MMESICELSALGIAADALGKDYLDVASNPDLRTAALGSGFASHPTLKAQRVKARKSLESYLQQLLDQGIAASSTPPSTPVAAHIPSASPIAPVASSTPIVPKQAAAVASPPRKMTLEKMLAEISDSDSPAPPVPPSALVGAGAPAALIPAPIMPPAPVGETKIADYELTLQGGKDYLEALLKYKAKYDEKIAKGQKIKNEYWLKPDHATKVRLTHILHTPHTFRTAYTDSVSFAHIMCNLRVLCATISFSLSTDSSMRTPFPVRREKSTRRRQIFRTTSTRPHVRQTMSSSLPRANLFKTDCANGSLATPFVVASCASARAGTRLASYRSRSCITCSGCSLKADSVRTRSRIRTISTRSNSDGSASL